MKACAVLEVTADSTELLMDRDYCGYGKALERCFLHPSFLVGCGLQQKCCKIQAGLKEEESKTQKRWSLILMEDNPEERQDEGI